MAKIALLIGVSEYAPGLDPLPGAVKDVDAMRRVLVNPEKGGFAEADVTVLKNPQRQEMEDAIYSLFANRQKDDLLLFYFSGHGVKDESGSLYLSTVATRKENGKLVKPSAVAARFLQDSMNESKSQRKVIVLDCCFSGAFAKGWIVKDDGSVNLQEELGGKGRVILTSSSSTQYSFSGSTQYSFEQEGSELSVYTRYLVEGIESGAADKDGDGQISAEELHEYASDKVTEASPNMTPNFYTLEKGYNIFLAKSRKDDPKLNYRKEVEIRAKQNQGKFSVIARSLLDSKRVEWGISEEEAKAIEYEVLQPFREYERKLQEYERCLMEAIEAEYPFSQSTEAELKDYQKQLGLRDEDIAPIKEKVIPKKIPPRPNLWTRQRFLKLAGLGGVGFIVTLIFRTFQENPPPLSIPSTPPSQPIPKLEKFEFDVVTLDAEGTPKSRDRKQAEFFVENLGNGVTLEMVKIPGGNFMMGSPDTEIERSANEGLPHPVTIKPFFIGKYTVTQAQWREVAGFDKVKIVLNPNPSSFKGKKRPVEKVSWHEAVEFCARLSRKTGRNYRLPSEAEWEYACRAGTITPFHFGETISTKLANYNGDTYGYGVKGTPGTGTTDVGFFRDGANAFGLYDMHGNILEWCADLTEDEKANRLLRGGSWSLHPRNCRSAFRYSVTSNVHDNNFGFRVACSLP